MKWTASSSSTPTTVTPIPMATATNSSRGSRPTPRRLVVIAYDDREIMLDGKKVVGPDGGTFRATERMRTRFAKDVTFAESTSGDIVTRSALDGHIELIVHTNPKNRILHTTLVGEMNGLLHGLGDRGFGGPRAYTKFIQPAPGIPRRPADAIGGAEFFRRIDNLTRANAKRESPRRSSAATSPTSSARSGPSTLRRKTARERNTPRRSRSCPTTLRSAATPTSFACR